VEKVIVYCKFRHWGRIKPENFIKKFGPNPIQADPNSAYLSPARLATMLQNIYHFNIPELNSRWFNSGWSDQAHTVTFTVTIKDVEW